ncbi:TRAP transporter substrate-binding protein DctP [Geopsychrobacter electrodiphilus]|uniref:TRAP transporter substrate-binding protein DctP n=1 Tax=Geopsychrobacter electrodiphilus TaxID=225196 RepID=UPI000370E1A3|nr:TRAP transporter substrate-binding protein DctP [Geopsychrobacter electrodiphilus]
MPYVKVLLALLFLFQLSAVVHAEPILIKFSQGADANQRKVKVCKYFKRLVEQRTNNRIALEFVAGGKHGDETESLLGLQSGTLQMAAPGISALSGFKPSLQVFYLPFLFKNKAQRSLNIGDQVVTKLLADSGKSGLIVLSFWDNGQEPDQEKSVPGPGSHDYQGYLVLVNAVFWSRLPDDLQVIIQGAIKDAADYAREMSNQIDTDVLSKMQASGKVRIDKLFLQ